LKKIETQQDEKDGCVTRWRWRRIIIMKAFVISQSNTHNGKIGVTNSDIE
nr:hypothetical protein [Tanacetum cinerariifolium]